jgi:hypothetical protein
MTADDFNLTDAIAELRRQQEQLEAVSSKIKDVKTKVRSGAYSPVTGALSAMATVAIAAVVGAFSVAGIAYATAATGLNPHVAPGGNFNLSVWELQLPIGSPGSPTTIRPSRLKGAHGYQNRSYFWTDKHDGSMTFWDPEAGVTTPHSKFARTELREVNSNGTKANWPMAGSNTLSGKLRVVSVTSHVCVGQVHLGSGGTSTKPLAELYYYRNGDIYLGTEKSPSGGQTRHYITHVALGVRWTYVINVNGKTINLTVNGSKTSYSIPASFDAYHLYFKAGDYNQSSSSSTSRGAKVKFYRLTVSHRR